VHAWTVRNAEACNGTNSHGVCAQALSINQQFKDSVLLHVHSYTLS
jgi:hypothetical protein